MPRVLIVSDDPPVLVDLRAAFVARGFDVLAAQTGADGVELAGRHELDGIIVDLDLAEGRGIETGHRLSQQNIRLERNVPVWMLTTPRGAETRRWKSVCGPAAVWIKPIEATKLARRFEAHLVSRAQPSPVPAATQPALR